MIYINDEFIHNTISMIISARHDVPAFSLFFIVLLP